MASTDVGAGIDKKQNKINSVSNPCFHDVCSTKGRINLSQVYGLLDDEKWK